MTHQSQFDDETLMAYADGELDAETAQAVARALEIDPALAERVGVFSRTAALLGTASRARTNDPLPPELAGAVAEVIARSKTSHPTPSGEVLRFPTRGTKSNKPVFVRYAMAASVALVVGLAGGYLLPRGYEETANSTIVAALATPAISAALSSLPSGERSAVGDGEIEIIATFTAAENDICREFELAVAGQTAVSVSCLKDDQWEPRFAVLSGAMDSTSYVPASSLAALDAYLASVGADLPMDVTEERAVLERLQ